MTGLEPLLFGSALVGPTATGAALTGGSAGLFGAAGVFSAKTALGTLGTVASLGSSLFSGMADSRQAGAEIQANRLNSANERYQAAETERNLRREQYLRSGSQIAAGAAQGRGISGNVLDIMADTAYQSEMDILGLRASNKISQELYKSSSKSIKSSSRLSTGASILTGVTKLSKSGVT